MKGEKKKIIIYIRQPHVPFTYLKQCYQVCEMLGSVATIQRYNNYNVMRTKLKL